MGIIVVPILQVHMDNKFSHAQQAAVAQWS